jgi:hypothetical protein
MRVNVMFGLDHVEEGQRNDEAFRLLDELSKKIYAKYFEQIKVGDVFILRDINGNRVGVADILEDRV